MTGARCNPYLAAGVTSWSGQRLSVPPGLESDLGEARFRWTVRETFPDDAYEHLVRPAPAEPDETAE